MILVFGFKGKSPLTVSSLTSTISAAFFCVQPSSILLNASRRSSACVSSERERKSLVLVVIMHPLYHRIDVFEGLVNNTFSEIENREIADPPLYLEWNIWRAFAMLDDGDIFRNFKVDDDGVPLYPAGGNVADVECKYKDFETIVEVTMSSGQKQYEMEGEPVARHYGDYKKATGKDFYCIFIAPKLSDAAIAHYYILYRTNVERYAGNAKIIPISLADFKGLLSNAYQSKKKPTSIEIKRLWSELSDLALQANSETEWYKAISTRLKTAFK